MDECRAPPRPTGAPIHDAPLHYNDDGDVAQRAYEIFEEQYPKQPLPLAQILTGSSSKKAPQPDQEPANIISTIQ